MSKANYPNQRENINLSFKKHSSKDLYVESTDSATMPVEQHTKE